MAGHSDAGHWQRDGAFAARLIVSVVLTCSFNGCIRTDILDHRFAERHIGALRLLG
jgi:hypothetical protein